MNSCYSKRSSWTAGPTNVSPQVFLLQGPGPPQHTQCNQRDCRCLKDLSRITSSARRGHARFQLKLGAFVWRPNTKSPYSSTIFWERRDELKGLELRQDRDAEAELRWRLAGDSQGRRCKTALVVHDIDAMRSKTAPGRGTKWRGSLNRMQKPPDF